MENIKSTKFWLVILVLGLSYAMVWGNKLEPQAWFEWATGLVALYVTGNVLSKLVEK